MLERTLRIDCELETSIIDMRLYDTLARLAPYGIGNPEPIFTSQVTVQSVRTVGADGKHLKLNVNGLPAIAFGQGALGTQLKVGDPIKIAYSLSLDRYNKEYKLQLKVKDIQYGRPLQEDPKL